MYVVIAILVIRQGLAVGHVEPGGGAPHVPKKGVWQPLRLKLQLQDVAASRHRQAQQLLHRSEGSPESPVSKCQGHDLVDETICQGGLLVEDEFFPTTAKRQYKKKQDPLDWTHRRPFPPESLMCTRFTLTAHTSRLGFSGCRIFNMSICSYHSDLLVPFALLLSTNAPGRVAVAALRRYSTDISNRRTPGRGFGSSTQ